jgi:hypothetical protein
MAARAVEGVGARPFAVAPGDFLDGHHAAPAAIDAPLLKEAFQQLWDYNSPAWAGKFLDEWCRQTMRSRIEPMKKIAPFPPPAPRVDPQLLPGAKADFQWHSRGLNNKAKVTMRKSYGSTPTECWNWPSITHLASCRSPNPPTISSDEPKKIDQPGVFANLTSGLPKRHF